MCNVYVSSTAFQRVVEAFEVELINSLNRYAPIHDIAENPFRHWRDIARMLERRWRERTNKLRSMADEPQNPADARDDEHATGIDTVAMQQILPEDIRFYCKTK